MYTLLSVQIVFGPDKAKKFPINRAYSPLDSSPNHTGFISTEEKISRNPFTIALTLLSAPCYILCKLRPLHRFRDFPHNIILPAESLVSDSESPLRYSSSSPSYPFWTLRSSYCSSSEDSSAMFVLILQLLQVVLGLAAFSGNQTSSLPTDQSQNASYAAVRRETFCYQENNTFA